MKNHLLIAGTGRAGTTFLVQYLAECGLDTHLARNQHPGYDEDANAGLEDLLLGNADAPYVVKSPWLYEYVERLLADREIVVDAVIIPMRSIVEAATSRSINELRARYGNPTMPDDCKQWESWGTTAGGIVYSLNPIDQARLLALGFHELLHALVKRSIPVVLLDFPRLVDDPNYLYESLHSVLGSKVERASALRAHERIAVPSRVRIGKELTSDDAVKCLPESGAKPPGIAFPSHAVLDRTALKRQLDKTVIHAEQLTLEKAALKRELEKARIHAEQLTSGKTALQRERDEATTRTAQLTLEKTELNQRLKESAICIAQMERRVVSLQASHSWRVTAPMRAVSGVMKNFWRVAFSSRP
ncbi:hypothetical protein [Variovorax paradoxus]|uniref:hypothetical protein n=1 Tax=Variovorax paradoxus TaxID=34073 RepID=UPI00278AB5E6|nr:hypothetical protein [Variovorax paradoxus]MDP9931078.1 regulator of replication initiation timing [Variovorax paradoxus]